MVKDIPLKSDQNSLVLVSQAAKESRVRDYHELFAILLERMPKTYL